MEKLNQVNWKEIITEIVLPHLGTLTLYIVLFCILGFITSIFYNLILWKKNIFVRHNKYYNWFVKLYIPGLVFVFLYFSVQFAFIYGAKKIIKDEEAIVVSELYDVSTSQFFKSPQEREDFILKLQQSSASLQKLGNQISQEVDTYVAQNNTGYNIIDNTKNKLTHYVIKEYETNLYSAVLYGMLKASGSLTEKEQIENMSYNEVNLLIKKLNTVDPKDIETSVKAKLTEFIDKIISSQINGFAKTTLFIFLLIIFLPILEYLIYRWWINRKEKANQIITK
jgi:hypothetical protein